MLKNHLNKYIQLHPAHDLSAQFQVEITMPRG